MKHRRTIMTLLFVVGAALLLGSIAGLWSLYAASREYERTTATVRSIQTNKVYRQRKLRYESKMIISYPAGKYGTVSVAATSHCPFRRKGDEVKVWYHPDRPRDIRRPRSESIIYGLIAAAGLLCIGGGTVFRGIKETDITNKQQTNNKPKTNEL